MDDCLVGNFSNYSDEDVDAMLYSVSDQYLFGVILPLIMVLGILSNLAFLIVYRSIRRMKTRTNIYLANLAVADILYLIFGVGDKVALLSLSPIKFDNERLSGVWCVTVWPLIKMFAFASVFFVTMVTVDKYFAVCHPFRVRRSSKRRFRIFLNPVRFVCGAWVTAFLCAATSIPTYGRMVHVCAIWPSGDRHPHLPDKYGFCEKLYGWADGFSYVFQMLVFFSALLPNLYMYVMIIRTLHRRVRGAKKKNTQLRNYVAKMLVINGSVFFLCMIPFYSFSLVLRIYGEERIPDWVIYSAKFVSQSLLYFNSCVNPLIYNVANPRYRTAFVETFRCRKIRHVQGKMTDTTTLTRPIQVNKKQTQL